jgi:hypothetical protein
VSFQVPDDCVSILGIAVAGYTVFDASANARTVRARAAISSNPADTFGNITSGNNLGCLMFSAEFSPEFPVSPGERLLVCFEDISTAIVYFTEASM